MVWGAGKECDISLTKGRLLPVTALGYLISSGIMCFIVIDEPREAKMDSIPESSDFELRLVLEFSAASLWFPVKGSRQLPKRRSLVKILEVDFQAILESRLLYFHCLLVLRAWLRSVNHNL